MGEKRVVRRGIAIVLGIICIILAAGFAEILLRYIAQGNEKDEVIASLNNQVSSKDARISQLNSQVADQNVTISSPKSQIDQLNSNLSNLQKQAARVQETLNDILHVKATVVTIDQIQNYTFARSLLNETVVVEGKLVGPISFFEEQPPYNYELFRPNETSESSTVYFGVLWHGNDTYDLRIAIVVGILRFASAGQFTMGGYFIEAENVILL